MYKEPKHQLQLLIAVLCCLFFGFYFGTETKMTQATAPQDSLEISNAECQGTAVTIGNDKVYSVTARQDYPSAGMSTWYYCIESGTQPAISHVTFGLAGCQAITDYGTWDGTSFDNLRSGDGKPEMTSMGLKFDEGFNDGESRAYYFTLNGNYEMEAISMIHLKASTRVDVGDVAGPSCGGKSVNTEPDDPKDTTEATPTDDNSDRPGRPNRDDVTPDPDAEPEPTEAPEATEVPEEDEPKPSDEPSGLCEGEPIAIGNDWVSFVDVRNDYPSAGQSTWYYCLESGFQPSISHVTFNLEQCKTVMDSGTWDTSLDNLKSGAGIPEMTDLGLKFDRGFEDGEIRRYYFTLDDNYPTTDIAILDIKAATSVDVGMITGPTCNPNPPTPTVTPTNTATPEPTNTPAATATNTPAPTATHVPAALGDRVWNDVNGDGVQDADEPGVAEIIVRLLDKDGNVLAETTTDEDGNYLFDNLDPKQSYVIEFVIPEGVPMLFTTPGVGSSENDSNATPDADDEHTGRTEPIILSPGETNLTIDAGLVNKLASLGGLVWDDLNGNDFIDEGEPGIPGLDVILLTDDDGDGTADGELATTQTDAAGLYIFDELDSKMVYLVTVEQPDNYFWGKPSSQDEPTDSAFDNFTGMTPPLELDPCDPLLNVNEGFVSPDNLIGDPTAAPTVATAVSATEEPTVAPTATAMPTDTPTDVPPTDVPTDVPTDTPTDVPTDTPTDVPTDTPTDVPPTDVPTDVPTDAPTDTPMPTDTPTEIPPTDVPTDTPTIEPSATTTPTDTPAPTDTPEPTATATATPGASIDPTAPRVYTLDYSVVPDEAVVVVIEGANLPGLATSTLEIIYDPTMLEAITCSKDPDSNFDLEQCNPNFAADTIRFNVTSLTGVSGNVPLAEVTFKAIGPNESSSPIEIRIATFANSNGDTVEAVIQSGSVTISSMRRGDVNCDDSISPIDALFTLQHDVGLRDSTEVDCTGGRSANFNARACDVSGDSRCNAVDALFILQCDIGFRNRLCPAHVSSRNPNIP